MKTSKQWKPSLGSRGALAFGMFMATAFVAPDSASATGGGRHRPHNPACFPLNGTISVSVTAEGCTSPVGFCTRGNFRSNFISGTTSYRATGLGGAAVGEVSIVTPPSEPASTWSYAGELTLTTRLGTIVFTDVGVLDNASAMFTELNRPISGTGSFEGVTGQMFVSGNLTPDGTGFEGAVSGRLCVPID